MFATILLLLLLPFYSRQFIHYRNSKLPTFLLGRPPGGFMKTMLYNTGGSTFSTNIDSSGLIKFNISQPIDHNNPSLGTWNQRVQYNPTYYANNSLVFLMIGGESMASDAWALNPNYTYIRWAQKYGAAIYQLEHRFFGFSRPYNDLKTESLKYCTTEQALSDLAQFIRHMNSEMNYTNPRWITFGGSYPGSLNAWFRAKYPELTVGAVASSAPLNLKLDFYEYAMVVEDALNQTDPTCRQKVGNAFEEINKKLLTTEGRNELNEKFELDPPFSDTHLAILDLQNFVANLFAVFQGVVQYTYDGRNSVTMGGLNIANLCNQLNASENGVQQIKAVVDWVNSFYPAENNSTKFANSYKEMLNELSNTTFDDDQGTERAAYRGWMWLCCNEIGFLQTTDQGKNIFGSMVPLNYFIDMCTDMFGESVRVSTIRDNNIAAQKRYGLAEEYNATNIVLPNGSLDPWHALGTYREAPEQHLTPLLIEGAAHCADMYPMWEGEPTALNAARERIESELRYFIEYGSATAEPVPESTTPDGSSAMYACTYIPIIICFILFSYLEQ